MRYKLPIEVEEMRIGQACAVAVQHVLPQSHAFCAGILRPDIRWPVQVVVGRVHRRAFCITTVQRLALRIHHQRLFPTVQVLRPEVVASGVVLVLKTHAVERVPHLQQLALDVVGVAHHDIILAHDRRIAASR